MNLMTFKKKFIFIFTEGTCFLEFPLEFHSDTIFEVGEYFKLKKAFLETAYDAPQVTPLNSSGSSSTERFYLRASGTSTYKNRALPFSEATGKLK